MYVGCVCSLVTSHAVPAAPIAAAALSVTRLPAIWRACWAVHRLAAAPTTWRLDDFALEGAAGREGAVLSDRAPRARGDGQRRLQAPSRVPQLLATASPSGRLYATAWRRRLRW